VVNTDTYSIKREWCDIAVVVLTLSCIGSKCCICANLHVCIGVYLRHGMKAVARHLISLFGHLLQETCGIET
jgi:hypothetical protein